MATTTDSKPVQASEETKRQTAARPKGQDKLPDVPGLNLSPESFFAYTRELSAQNWEHSLVYIYRGWPLLLARSPKYVEKLSRSFDESYILAEHGSGDYYFTLNDTDIKGRQQSVCQVQKMRPLRIRDDERPPKLNIADLDLNDPVNTNYVKKLIAEGKLTPQGEIPPTPSGGGDAELARTVRETIQVLLRDKLDNKRGDPLEAQVFGRTLDMLSKASDRSVDMVLAQVKQQDPNHFIQMLAALKELMPAGTAGDRLVEQLLRENSQSRQENRELMMKLIDIKSQPAPSMVDEIEKFKMLKDVMSDGGGGGRGGTAAILAEALPALAPYIAPTLGVVGNFLGGIFGQLFNRGGQTPQRQPGPGNPAGTGPHPVDLGPTQISSAQPGGEMPNPQPAQPQVDPAVQQLVQFLPVIHTTFLKYINEGRTGADFAGWIADSFGELSYGMIQRLSKEQILQAMSLSPQLAPVLQGMPEQLGQFIDEFLNPDSVPEEPEPAAEPKRRGKKNEPPVA